MPLLIIFALQSSMATSDADLSCVLSVYSLLATLHIVPSGCIKASKDSVISLIPEMMIKSAEHGVYFCLEQPLRAKLPLLGKFKAIDNVIFLAAQERPMGTYLWGVPVDPLLNWTPPKGTALIEEDKLLWRAKLPHADVTELAEIENTVMHPQLRAMVDKFISHCPTFKSAGIRSISDLQCSAIHLQCLAIHRNCSAMHLQSTSTSSASCSHEKAQTPACPVVNPWKRCSMALPRGRG